MALVHGSDALVHGSDALVLWCMALMHYAGALVLWCDLLCCQVSELIQHGVPAVGVRGHTASTAHSTPRQMCE